MSIQGNWTLYYSWGCTGSYTSTSITFNSDGTYKDGQGNSGRWMQVSGTVVFIYNSGSTPSYAGNVVSSAMTGMIATPSGSTGCWYALSQSLSQAKLEKGSGALDASGAKV